MSELFKLTAEMIEQIEEKVNKGLADVNNGMKERIISAGCYNDYYFFAACWITIGINDSRVQVIDPIKSYDEDEDDEDDCSDF